nr:MAG TPA: hypothetical protein [Caudoviricetes sp.]
MILPCCIYFPKKSWLIKYIWARKRNIKLT